MGERPRPIPEAQQARQRSTLGNIAVVVGRMLGTVLVEKKIAKLYEAKIAQPVISLHQRLSAWEQKKDVELGEKMRRSWRQAGESWHSFIEEIKSGKPV